MNGRTMLMCTLGLTWMFALPRTVVLPARQDAKAVDKPVEAADPTLARLAAFDGQRWTSEGKIVAEFQFEKTNGGKGMRAKGVILKGTPQAMAAESIYGWDPINKNVYYFDFHGHDTVYKGTIKLVGEALESDFSGIVGDTGHYRSKLTFPDKDHMVSSLYGQKDGNWLELHTLTFKRQP
jgi:hypothetical protein